LDLAELGLWFFNCKYLHFVDNEKDVSGGEIDPAWCSISQVESDRF